MELSWTTWLFLGALAFVGLVRIGELIVSRRHAAAASARGVEVTKEGNFGLMVLLHASVFVVVPLEVLALNRPFSLPLFAAAFGVVLVATVVRVWALRTLGENWNVRVVAPKTVVTTGPYAWIRHPNYLVVILELAAIPLLHGAWLSALFLTALNAIVLARRIPLEERVLFDMPGYRDAMADKARFIPGVL